MVKFTRVKGSDPIATKTGTATPAFIRFWDQFCRGLERQEASQDASLAAIQAVQVQLAQQLDLINQALELAGLALETADGGGATKSGSATGVFGMNSPVFAATATVVLTSVSAGDLTLPGSGPNQQTGTTLMTGGTESFGEYQVVEVDNGVDGVVVFTGQFTVTDISTPDLPYQVFTINHTSADALAAFVAARTTTGDVDYRVETRRVSGADVGGMRFYLFARREA